MTEIFKPIIGEKFKLLVTLWSIKFENLGFEVIGLVTREEFDDLPGGAVSDESVTVYIPMSYMLGGFTGIFPRSSVREVDIPVERAIKLAITGWIKADKNAL